MGEITFNGYTYMIERQTFTQWAAEVDRMAAAAGYIERGASYTTRFNRKRWLEDYNAGMTAEEAWEVEEMMEDGE